MVDPASVLWLVPLLGLLQLALAADNLRAFQARPAGTEDADPAAGDVSILIPARDEAARIGACVRAALAQPEALEVLVLDDGSTDGTAAVARAAGAEDPRIGVWAGAPPPAGWAGKPYACWQLASQAAGRWLVFVDADVRLAPGAIAEALRRADAGGYDLLSFWPRQDLGSAGERLLVPLLDVVLLGFLPFRLAEARPDPAIAAANGQCLVFRAGAYDRAGGHAAVAGEVVEDVALARAMKRAGGRVGLTDAGDLARVRMYDGLASAWRGFGKSLYPAFGGRPGPFLVGIGLFAALHAWPPLLMVLGLLAGWAWLWAPMAAQVGLALAFRALLVARLGHPPGWALAHPLGAWVLVGLAFASWHAAARGAIAWKGRTYAVGARP